MTAEDYVRRVSLELGDLPWRQRRDLVAELEAHLAELPEETNFHERLGAPERYAADMRSAAGLERRRGLVAFLRARRPRNLILLVVTLAAIGLAIGAVAWIDSYQPIVFAGGTQLPPDSKPSAGQAGATVVFRRGRPFEYGITIHNDGRFTARVLGVPRSATDFFKARLYVNTPSPAENELPLERFRPFDLHPGETRWLVWKGVYACTTGMGGGGGGITTEAIAVRLGFLWRTTTVLIPLSDPLTITFPKGCPSKRVAPPTP